VADQSLLLLLLLTVVVALVSDTVAVREYCCCQNDASDCFVAGVESDCGVDDDVANAAKSENATVMRLDCNDERAAVAALESVAVTTDVELAGGLVAHRGRRMCRAWTRVMY